MLFERLDIVIAFVSILLGLSLLIMVFTQMISAVLNLRGVNLLQGLQTLIGTISPNLKGKARDIAKKVLKNELISDLSLQRVASTIREEELKEILEVLAKSDPDLKKALEDIRNGITSWFDRAMDRVAQRFVLHTRLVTAVFAVIVAFTMHLDAFQIYSQLSTDVELRRSVVADTQRLTDQAEKILGENTVAAQPEAVGALDELVAQARQIQQGFEQKEFRLIPIPYPGLFTGYSPGGRHFWGALAMAALLSLGAPFWFNALKKLTSLRPILAGKVDQEQRAKS